MQFGPDPRTGMRHQQTNRLAAVAQRHHEQPRAPVFARGCVADHRAVAVIDLALFAGRGLDDHTSFRRLAGVKLADEAPHTLVAGGEPASVHQILPDGYGVAAPRQPDFDRVPVRLAGA